MKSKQTEKYKAFMELSEVADYLGVHINSVYRYLRDGGKPLPSIRISRKKILVREKDLEEWLNNKVNNSEREI